MSIGDIDWSRCMAELERLEFAEIRLDRMPPAPEAAAKAFSTHPALVATCRPGSFSDDRRLVLLRQAMMAGAAWVDIELDAPRRFFDLLVPLARDRGCGVIVSHHDTERTPARSELVRLRKACFDAGADTAKIACRVSQPADELRLVALMDYERPVIALGMGEKALLGRLAAAAWGPFGYACLPDRPMAPGQPSHLWLKKQLEEFGHG